MDCRNKTMEASETRVTESWPTESNCVNSPIRPVVCRCARSCMSQNPGSSKWLRSSELRVGNQSLTDLIGAKIAKKSFDRSGGPIRKASPTPTMASSTPIKSHRREMWDRPVRAATTVVDDQLGHPQRGDGNTTATTAGAIL